MRQLLNDFMAVSLFVCFCFGFVGFFCLFVCVLRLVDFVYFGFLWFWLVGFVFFSLFCKLTKFAGLENI